MDLRIPYIKKTNQEEAFKAVRNAITEDTLAKFKVSADLDYDEMGKNIFAKGKGFDLVLDFGEQDIGVRLDLSFMLKPFKGKVLETIEKMVKRVV